MSKQLPYVPKAKKERIIAKFNKRLSEVFVKLEVKRS